MVDFSAYFASALFDVAKEEGAEAKIDQQLQTLSTIWQENADLVALMKHPELKKQSKIDLIHSVFSKELDPVLLRFLEVCIAHDQAGHIPAIALAYQAKRRKAENIELVKVESASALDKEQTDSLMHVLEDRLHKKVQLQVEIVPELIAGLRVQTEDLVLDNTVLARLNAIKEQLKHVK